MHRIDRVSKHFYSDVSANLVANPIAAGDIATVSRSTATGFAVQTDRATLLDPISSVSMVLNTAPTIQANSTFAFGRFVQGEHVNDEPMHYAVEGYCRALFSGVPTNIGLGFFIGRLQSGSVTQDYTAQVNLVDHPIALPLQCDEIAGNTLKCSVSTLVLDGLHDGGATEFTTQPIGVFMGLQNDATGLALNFLRMSLSVYRYRGDVSSFDPTR